MFKFIPERIIKGWPAHINVAMDDGRSKSFPVTLDLKMLPSSEYRALAARGDEMIFPEIVKGWSGIHDEAGTALPFTEDNLRHLTNHPGFAQAVMRAYLRASSGEAARKN
ncbi:hypothetical protein [Candidatus Sororendozoicomonas aggregata]|uniref:hypothetical protein n=1 Tax=Candidatus Sororendozoicomonas aggregata TaxID=3073239 RepID=UPI002ED0E8FA